MTEPFIFHLLGSHIIRDDQWYCQKSLWLHKSIGFNVSRQVIYYTYIETRKDNYFDINNLLACFEWHILYLLLLCSSPGELQYIYTHHTSDNHIGCNEQTKQYNLCKSPVVAYISKTVVVYSFGTRYTTQCQHTPLGYELYGTFSMQIIPGFSPSFKGSLTKLLWFSMFVLA